MQVRLATLAVALAVALGSRVSLVSPELDSRVLVFDHQDILDDYQYGHWHAEEVTSHSILVEPGTKAIIVSIRGSDFGVKVTTGEFSGRFGWVAIRDIR